MPDEQLAKFPLLHHKGTSTSSLSGSCFRIKVVENISAQTMSDLNDSICGYECTQKVQVTVLRTPETW